MNKGASSVMLRIFPLLLPILLGVVVPVYSALPPALSPAPMAAMPSDCPELLANGDFEAGSLAPWASAGAVGLDWGRNGTHGAWLGRGDNVFGELRQAVTIPSGANPVTLEYWWLAQSQNDQYLDVLTILVEEAGQPQELRTWRAIAPFDQWRQDALDLTAYAGRSISVVFLVRTDTSVPSAFVVDDVSLRACGGTMPTATATRTQTPMATNTQSPTPSATTEHTPAATLTTTPGESLMLVVNTTDDADDGTCDATHCSLREAVYAADAHSGPSTITFNIPASDPGCDANGVCTIRPTAFGYYLVNGPITIDGYTQPGASPNTAPFGQPINAVLKIVLDGSLIPENTWPDGLSIRSAGNIVRGLVIQHFNNGIDVWKAGNNRIEGCFVGTDATGTVAMGNRNCAIAFGSSEGEPGPRNCVVGGNVPQARNLISGNGTGIEIGPDGYAIVQGNYIGTDASGTGALGQTNGNGVRVFNISSHNLIGGTGAEEANLIAYNGEHGIEIDGYHGTDYNTITRNRIHSNAQKGIALLNGGNNGLAAPAIFGATRTEASGTACANCTVEVFSDAVDEGAIYEGTTTADASGQWTLSKPAGFSGPNLTATATDPSGNTSEFSTAFSLPS